MHYDFAPSIEDNDNHIRREIVRPPCRISATMTTMIKTHERGSMAHAINHGNSEGKHEISPLELFFDLVFVFAVSQLSHHLAKHLSWRGAAEVMVMLVAVFTMWSYTSWAAIMISASRPKTRWMILLVMLLGLFMNAAVTKAFTTSGWAFVSPLLLIQFGRTLWTIANAPSMLYRDHYIRVLVWFVVTLPLWIAGAAATPEDRLLWWAPAAVIELIGTMLAHPLPWRRLQSEGVPFEADHMQERCRLFLLIALGETVIAAGTAISEASLTSITILTGAFALVGTGALWALSFGASDQIVSGHLKETSNPIRSSRYTVNILVILVAGLIAVAVANEVAIVHPIGNTTIALSLLLTGGPIIFLGAQGWYLWAVTDTRPRLQVIGIAALLIVGICTQLVPPYVALIFVATTLVILVAFDRP
jgi:low temperature requirement protein LtrA